VAVAGRVLISDPQTARASRSATGQTSSGAVRHRPRRVSSVGGSFEKVRGLWWAHRSVGRPVQPPPGLPARIIPCRGDQLPRPLDHHLPWRRRSWERPKPSLEFERDRPFGAREVVLALHTSLVRAVLIDAERHYRSPCIVDRAGTNPCARVTSRRDGLHALRQHDAWIRRRLLLVATTCRPYSWVERISMPAGPSALLPLVTARQPVAQLYASVLLSLQSCAFSLSYCIRSRTIKSLAQCPLLTYNVGFSRSTRRNSCWLASLDSGKPTVRRRLLRSSRSLRLASGATLNVRFGGSLRRVGRATAPWRRGVQFAPALPLCGGG
jgi:hypothetical protein